MIELRENILDKKKRKYIVDVDSSPTIISIIVKSNSISNGRLKYFFLIESVELSCLSIADRTSKQPASQHSRKWGLVRIDISVCVDVNKIKSEANNFVVVFLVVVLGMSQEARSPSDQGLFVYVETAYRVRM